MGAEQPDRGGEAVPELRLSEDVPPPGDQTLVELPGDRYRAVARLGAGAFGEVYRARDSVLGRDVAIKRIRLEAFADPSQLEDVKRRFLREAQVAARLRHPNIVTTHDIVATEATSFIVMELVEGRTLQDVLLERGKLPLDETVELLSQAASALDHAHASQVVHRDVKPGNIMVEPSGHVKVMDFGIAKVEAGSNLTSTGLILGTPNYMSPEQARGEKVDGRSDMFSLGCVLYECLSGRKPFVAESVTGILVKILTEEPPPIAYDAIGLPREIDAVVRRATAKDPSSRYSSGRELVEALRLAGQTTIVPAATVARPRVEPPPLPAPAPPATGTGPGTPSPPPRRAWKPLAALAVMAVLAIGAIVGWRLASGGSGERRPAVEGSDPVPEENPGMAGRPADPAPRQPVTVPAGTRLRLALGTPLSSETARAGDVVSAELTSPLRVDGVEAVSAGTRLVGRVAEAAPAAASGGRGRMTIEFERLETAAGDRVALKARPLELRAPATKKKKAGIVGGLAGVGAAVGGLLGGKRGAVTGTVVGGAAGVAVVSTAKGQEVTLAASAPLSVELLEPIPVPPPKQN